MPRQKTKFKVGQRVWQDNGSSGIVKRIYKDPEPGKSSYILEKFQSEGRSVFTCVMEGDLRGEHPEIATYRSKNAQPFTPTVYDVDKDGNISYVMDTSRAPREGYERRELRTLREVRQFERKVNAQETEKARAHAYKEDAYFEETRKRRHAELRDMARDMSPLARDYAEYVMKKNSQDRKIDKVKEAGFRIEGFN